MQSVVEWADGSACYTNAATDFEDGTTGRKYTVKLDRGYATKQSTLRGYPRFSSTHKSFLRRGAKGYDANAVCSNNRRGHFGFF